MAILKSLLRPFSRRLRQSPPARQLMWSGIYANFDDVPITGEGFEGRRFASETQGHTRVLLEGEVNKTDRLTSCHEGFLPLLVSMVATTAERKVRVLDFGGGTGAAFVNVLNATEAENIRFDLVETQSACKFARELFADDDRISFHSTLPDASESVDIVHVSSALQYMRDYKKTLIELCRFRARYVMLVNLSAGRIPTYVTAQRVYDDTVVAYWFLNVDEVIEIVAAESYQLIWKTSSQREYDQTNFPPEYRMGRTCNLLFERDGNQA